MKLSFRIIILTVAMVLAFTSCTFGKDKIADVDAGVSKTGSTNSTTEKLITEITDADVTSTSTTVTDKEESSTSKTTTKTTKAQTTSKKTTTTTKKSTDSQVTYIDGILIANKTYGLPSSYNPGVDSTAQSALNKMISAAKSDGIKLTVISDFRSYSSQERIYNNYVSRDGKAEADRYSARPGHSEHQTGLAFDLNSLSQSFENTAEGKWIAKNCYKYGFIIRFPKGKESKTGYMYEPWHVRYLGVDTATKVYNSGLCLEEYLNITSKY